MSWLPSDQTQELITFANWADREARSDLAGGYIQNEDDYTSHFTGALRRIINSNSKTGLSATSLKLAACDEQKTGTDAAIIISRHGQSKVTIFEAKWPRFSKKHYKWDYAQTASGLSHFSDQLTRQHSYNKNFAVFEMFYCEYEFNKQPPFMNDQLSSCVWHEDAHSFMNKRSAPDNIWSQSDLQNLLKVNNLGIDSILKSVCECSKGKILSFADPSGIAQEFHFPTKALAIKCD